MALRKTSKQKNEILLEFSTRFLVYASQYNTEHIHEKRRAQILFSKLPCDLQDSLAILNFDECILT